MTARLIATLASIARPALLAAAGLLAAGAGLAVVGVAAGWVVYLGGFLAAAVAIPALGAVHHGRLGRFGRIAFAILEVNIVLYVPVIAMVTTYALGLATAHVALMAYVMTPIGMTAALAINLSVVLAGVAILRARLLPPMVGWLMIGAAVAELPVELGMLPLQVWAASIGALAAGLVVAARTTSDPAAGTRVIHATA